MKRAWSQRFSRSERQNADAVRPAEPGNAYAVADGEAVDPGARLDDHADDLDARGQGKLRVVELAVDDVQVGPADGAGADADEDLVLVGSGRFDVGQGERLRDPVNTIAFMAEEASANPPRSARVTRADEVVRAVIPSSALESTQRRC